MGREQMRNLEISKVGVTQLNEFEYQKHQGELTEQEHAGQQKGSGKRLTKAQQIAQVTAAAHKKVEERRKKKGEQAPAMKTVKAKRTTKKKKR
ncbi:MAG TPA: hypothetical protein VLL54_18340 [Pyrinomonadaceae bacterium]|nr:hypothetical protein [Pyrinomonadaceae bacterium]